MLPSPRPDPKWVGRVDMSKSKPKGIQTFNQSADYTGIRPQGRMAGESMEREIDRPFGTNVKYLTQAEVAQRFRVSPSTIKNWRDQGKLEYFQPDGSSRVLYPRESVEDFERRYRRRAKNIEPRRPAEIKRTKPEVSTRPKKEWRI